MFVVSLTVVLGCCELRMGIYRRGLLWQSHLATMDCVYNCDWPSISMWSDRCILIPARRWLHTNDVFVTADTEARQSSSCCDLRILLFHFQVCRIFCPVIVDGE
jgi:hypothetical protein